MSCATFSLVLKMIEVYRPRVARGGNCSIARECMLFIVYFTTLKVLLSSLMRARDFQDLRMMQFFPSECIR